MAPWVSACVAIGVSGSQLVAQTLPGNVRVVRADAPPGGDGISWTTAFNRVQEALSLAAASGGVVNQIWVAQGNYTASLSPGSCTPFRVLANTSLYGGFQGVESALGQRPTGTRSRLSGGLECFGSSAVVLEISPASPVVVDGIEVDQSWGHGVVISGPATLVNVRVGPAVVYRMISSSGPGPIVLRDCWIENSSMTTFGPPVVLAGPGEIVGTHIVGREAFAHGVELSGLLVRNSDVGGFGDGGGLVANGVSFEDSLVRGDAWGTAMSTNDVTFNRCSVTTGSYMGLMLSATNTHFNETTFDAGGKVTINGGSIRRSRLTAALTSFGPSMVLTDVTATASTIGVQHLNLSGACTFVNSKILGGGRVAAPQGGSAVARFVNCLLQLSTTPPEYVIAVGPDWRFSNSIIWGSATTEAGALSVPPGQTGFINHSIVRGWSGQYGGAANSGADPLLNPDGSLQAGSPAIDSGDDTVLPYPGPYDLAGNCRFAAGVPNGAASIDRGPFEFTICLANCDCGTTMPILNVQDFTCFLQRYAAGEPYANCDQSTVPPVLNVQDFTCFLQRYAAGCP